jgi:hypothetical protein
MGYELQVFARVDRGVVGMTIDDEIASVLASEYGESKGVIHQRSGTKTSLYVRANEGLGESKHCIDQSRSLTQPRDIVRRITGYLGQSTLKSMAWSPWHDECDAACHG